MGLFCCWKKKKKRGKLENHPTYENQDKNDYVPVMVKENEPPAISPHNPDPSAISPHNTDPPAISPHNTDPSAISPHNTDPSAISPHNTDPPAISPHNTDPSAPLLIDLKPQTDNLLNDHLLNDQRETEHESLSQTVVFNRPIYENPQLRNFTQNNDLPQPRNPSRVMIKKTTLWFDFFKTLNYLNKHDS